MGKDPDAGPRALSNVELMDVTQALELSLPPEAVVKGSSWPGAAEDTRNFRVSMWTNGNDDQPRHSVWLAERKGQVYRLRARPATAEELRELLDALRELGADQAQDEPVAEAEYDCTDRRYQLCFTPLEEMVEGLSYKRWILRRHRDGRPLSVGYVCETRRGDDYATLPGGAVLRGNPWSE
jgi:hypothetical protein